jgi:hypothetical protein
MTEKIELIPASMWDCPECGKENFERMIRIEKSHEDMENMKEAFGIPQEEDGEFLMRPLHVVCGSCDNEFDVEEPPLYK